MRLAEEGELGLTGRAGTPRPQQHTVCRAGGRDDTHVVFAIRFELGGAKKRHPEEASHPLANHRVVADKEECVTRIFACPLKTTWHGFSSAVIAGPMLR